MHKDSSDISLGIGGAIRFWIGWNGLLLPFIVYNEVSGPLGTWMDTGIFHSNLFWIRVFIDIVWLVVVPLPGWFSLRQEFKRRPEYYNRWVSAPILWMFLLPEFRWFTLLLQPYLPDTNAVRRLLRWIRLGVGFLRIWMVAGVSVYFMMLWKPQLSWVRWLFDRQLWLWGVGPYILTAVVLVLWAVLWRKRSSLSTDNAFRPESHEEGRGLVQ